MLDPLAPRSDLASVRSPKSVAFPVDAIVIKSIVVLQGPDAAYPPANSPRVGLDVAAKELLPTDELSPEEILKFRDKAYLEYHTYKPFLDKVRNKYGDIAADNILENTKIKLIDNANLPDKFIEKG